MVQIHMANVYSAVVGLNENQEAELSFLLSYTIGGFGSPLTTKNLYDCKNKKTYTGLVPRIIQYLTQNSISYEIIDKRQTPKQNASFAICKGFKARDYQEVIVNRASSREIIQAATGAGKTFIMANLICKYNVKPVIVIAPKVSLAEQIKSEFEKFLGINIGIVGGGHNDIKDITICTPMSAPDDLLESAQAILFDECHNIPANKIFKAACKARNAYYRVGVSATPWRDGEDEILIEASLNIRRPKLSITASMLIKKGALTPCNIVFVPVKDEFEWNGSYHKLYTKAIVNNENRNSMITKIAINMLQKKHTTLILINKIKHGQKLKQKLQQIIGFDYQETNLDGNIIKVEKIEFLSGKDSADRRNAVLEGVKNGFVKILIGSTIADEGLDLPILDCLILAGSGRSTTKAFQRIGRVLRLYKNKTEAIVFDFMDETKTFKKHALIREALYKTEPLWNIQKIS